MRVAGAGPKVTARDDPRVTPVGEILRATKLDELPRALERPARRHVPRGAAAGGAGVRRSRGPAWREVLRSGPGLTDPVTLRLRDEESLLAQRRGGPGRYYRECSSPGSSGATCEYLDGGPGGATCGCSVETGLAIVCPRWRTACRRRSTSGTGTVPKALKTARDRLASCIPSSRCDAIQPMRVRRASPDAGPAGSLDAIVVGAGGIPSTSGSSMSQERTLLPLLTRGLQFALDIAALVAAFVLAYLLRFEFVRAQGRARATRFSSFPTSSWSSSPRSRWRACLQLHLALRRDGGGQGLPLRGALVGARARRRCASRCRTLGRGGSRSRSSSWARSSRSAGSSGCASPRRSSTSCSQRRRPRRPRTDEPARRDAARRRGPRGRAGGARDRRAAAT